MKSVLVIGLGRFGRHLSRKFIEEGNAVLAIEKDETRADWAVNIVNEIQIGDATNEDFIKSLGVNNFHVLPDQNIELVPRVGDHLNI